MLYKSWYRWTILFVGLLENLVFSGSILGWSALNYMLKQEGVFSSLCHHDASDPIYILSSHGNQAWNSTEILDRNENNPEVIQPFVSSDDNWNPSNLSTPPTSFMSYKDYPLIDSFINYSLIPQMSPMSLVPPSRSLSNESTESSSQSHPSLWTSGKTSMSVEKGNKIDLILKTCPAQDRMLNLAYTLGIFFNGFTAFIWGFLLDKWGLRTVRLVINAFLLIGSLLLCFTSNATSYFAFPAVILLALGGVPLRIANMQFANLFPQNRSTVITFYSGAFSASAVLFVILKYAYDGGVSFSLTCSSLVLLSCLMIPFTVFVLPSDQVREPEEIQQHQRKLFANKSNKKYGAQNLALAASTVTLEKYKTLSTPDLPRKSYREDNNHDERGRVANNVLTLGAGGVKTNPLILYTHPHFSGLTPLDVSSLDVEGRDIKDVHDDDEVIEEEDTASEISTGSSSIHSTPKLPSTPTGIVIMTPKANRPPSTDSVESTASTDSEVSRTSSDLRSEIPLTFSLLSIPFTLHQWWFSWLLTYMIMYVGTMNLWLDRVTEDASVADTFSKVFGIIQVSALILAPLAGFLMDYRVNEANKHLDDMKRRLARVQAGFWPMMFTTATLTAILICRFFNNTTAVYVSILFITLLRSFLVAVGSAYLRIRFPATHFNKLLGIMSTFSAFVTLLQFPLFIWEANHVDNAVWVNLFNCMCTLLAFTNPLHLIITPLQRKFIQKEMDQTDSGNTPIIKTSNNNKSQ